MGEKKEKPRSRVLSCKRGKPPPSAGRQCRVARMAGLRHDLVQSGEVDLATYSNHHMPNA
eukprot:5375730-Amphidinium_carterae.2